MIQLDRYDATRVKLARERGRGVGSVPVADSGGVDSTLLLKLAIDELGDRAVAALASSPAYPESEQQEARDLARSLGARLVEVTTSEVELDAYARNNPDRCFHCKEELFDTLAPVQQDLGLAHLAYGATADDAGDHRPGHGSAVRRGVQFPLLEAGMAKSEIRAAARALGLPNWRGTAPEVSTGPGERAAGSPSGPSGRLPMNGEEVVLSLDEGTTGATAIAVGIDGEVRGKGYEEIAQHYPRPGWVEHDATEI